MTTGRRPRSSVRFGAALLLALLTNGAYGQELTSLYVSHSEVGIGEQIEITLQLKPIPNSKQTVCNLVLDFGDGSSEQVRVTSPRLAFSVKHSYQRPGPTAIRAEGKTRFQGLQTAIGCFGDAKSVAVNVLPEDYAARRAAALGEKEAALKQAEADKRAADAAAAEAQLQRNAAQNAARRARTDRAAADKAAREGAAKRAAAQRDLQSTPPAKPTSIANPPVEERPRPKSTSQPKPKSSLDL
jgi:hypothetical protein